MGIRTSFTRRRLERRAFDVRESFFDPENDPPDHYDLRFSERSEYLTRLYEQSELAQWRASALRAMSDADLIYLAGHIERPPAPFEDRDKAAVHTRWHKLRQNAERASKELQRRQASRLQLRTAVAAALVAVLAFGLGRCSDEHRTERQITPTTLVSPAP